MTHTLILHITDPKTSKQYEAIVRSGDYIGYGDECSVKIDSDFVERRHGIFEYVSGVGWRYMDSQNVNIPTIIKIKKAKVDSCASYGNPKIIDESSLIIISGAVIIDVLRCS